MSYTAMKKLRDENRRRFGADVGPMQPPLYMNRSCKNDLKSAALRFLHNECEGLCFDAEKEAEEERTGVYLGKSLRPGQIPYNMQMDINRLCLEKSLETFIDSGVAEDAYAVYYCWLEIFFGQYGRSRKMVELLSEYELNGSSLLMKHRDHYAHSVYVFSLGLALYETNPSYRKKFMDFYRLDPEKPHEAANNFLEYWGLTALFHDIGYPFELPFEQVLSYFEVNNQNRGNDHPYPVYSRVETMTRLDGRAAERFQSFYGRRFDTLTELLAFDITEKLGAEYSFTEPFMLKTLNDKPADPAQFGFFMDHAFFSATRLYAELEKILKPEALTAQHVDALSAIMLHNSLFKFSINYYKAKDPADRKPPLRAELHPLAWLLMLCDELQCWDRTAYGRDSRTELHPLDARFDFSDGNILAMYDYDGEERSKIDAFNLAYEAWKKDPDGGAEPRLKAYSDMAGDQKRFVTDIRKIVDLGSDPVPPVNEPCPDRGITLTVVPVTKQHNRGRKHVYLSGSSFQHMYDFAVALHARGMKGDPTVGQMEEKFSALSLEYQLSTLSRARYFAKYLDAIRCFYTDKPVAYEPVRSFTAKDAAVFAPMEHERWVREHQAMGWRYGNAYETLPLDGPKEEEKQARAALREQLRCHRLVMDGALTDGEIRNHYLHLRKADQDKDWRPFNNLLQLLKKYDGLRIYRL